MAEMKRFITLILAVLLAVTPLVACSDTPDGGEPKTTDDGGTQASTSDQPENNANTTLDVPKMSLGGEFKILAPQVLAANFTLVDFDEPSEDAYENAIYLRNQHVKEYLDVEITEVESESFDTLYDTFKISNEARSGDFNAVFNNMTKSATAVGAGMCTPFEDITYVDLEKDWWNDDCSEQLALGGNHYMIAGDIALSDKECIWAVYFTKDMIEENRLENPYDLVENNEWTWDKMHEMAIAAHRELAGDDVMDQSDIWGITTHSENWTAMWQSAGMKLVTLDSDGIPEITWGTEQFATMYQDIVEFMTDSTCVSPEDDKFIAIAFPEGRTLFATEVIAHVRNYRNNDYDFGIVPFPKYNSSVDKYYSYVAIYSCVLTVGNDNSDLERVGAVLETMAAYGHTDLTPVYYEGQIKSRFARDETTAEMLDIIFEHRSYDLGVFFDWGGAYTKLKGGDVTPTTLYTQVKRSMNLQMEDALQALGIF